MQEAPAANECVERGSGTQTGRAKPERNFRFQVRPAARLALLIPAAAIAAGLSLPTSASRARISSPASPAAASSAVASPFRAPRVIPFPAGAAPLALAASDFDRDGRLDLVVGTMTGKGGPGAVTFFSGDGRGGLRRGRDAAAGREPVELAAADFDRDGNLDLAVANHGAPLVTILLGDGRGGFRPAIGSPLSVRSLPHPHTIAACDVDADGALDLVIDSWGENRFTLLRGDGKGGFSSPGVSIEAGRRPYRNLRLADLDGDGRCDLVAPNLAEKSITVLLGDGRGGFRGAKSPPIAAGPAPFCVALGDVDRDGRIDVVLANYSGQISDPSGDGLTFLRNLGGGRFLAGPTIPTGRGSGDVTAGDVNGDGYADAVTANMGGTITVALGGPAGFSPARSVTIPAGGQAQRILLADFDGDGRADAVTANTDSCSISIFLTRAAPAPSTRAAPPPSPALSSARGGGASQVTTAPPLVAPSQ